MPGPGWRPVSWRALRHIARLAEVAEQAAEAVCDALVPVGLAFPAAFPGVVSELALKAEAFAEPRRVLRGGDELGTGQIEVALARAFLGQAQAVSAGRRS